jgi:hypothetical protein
LRPGVVSVSDPLPSYDPILPPPLHTVYVYAVYLIIITIISISIITQERGGDGGELTREKVGGVTVHKAGRKYQRD